MKVTAKSNAVLIKPESKEKKTASGFIIPDSAVDKTYERGEVLDIANMYQDTNDQEHEVAVGDRVLYKGTGVNVIKENKEEDLHLVSYSALLLKL